VAFERLDDRAAWAMVLQVVRIRNDEKSQVRPVLQVVRIRNDEKSQVQPVLQVVRIRNDEKSQVQPVDVADEVSTVGSVNSGSKPVIASIQDALLCP